MNDLKSFASRRLNELGFEPADRKRWARHGSTRWLWKREDVLAALAYVIDKQGEKWQSTKLTSKSCLPSRDHRERSPTKVLCTMNLSIDRHLRQFPVIS